MNAVRYIRALRGSRRDRLERPSASTRSAGTLPSPAESTAIAVPIIPIQHKHIHKHKQHIRKYMHIPFGRFVSKSSHRAADNVAASFAEAADGERIEVGALGREP